MIAPTGVLTRDINVGIITMELIPSVMDTEVILGDITAKVIQVRPRPGGYLPGHDHGGYPAGHYHEESDARTIYDQEMQTQAQEQIQKQCTLQGNLTKLDRFDFQEFAGTKDHLLHTA